MKTDELIAVLGDELKPARPGMVQRGLSMGLMAGIVVSLGLMMATIGVRPDLNQAMHLNAFWMKFFYTAALAILGFALIQRQARAGAESRNVILALAAPLAAMMVLASIQLSDPRANSAALLMGRTWMVCPWLIAALSLPIFAALVVVMRKLAPTRLSMAGASAGLVAGATAATIYGFHCTEMTAPFILIWYTLGIAVAAGVGAFLGRSCLRW